MINYDLDQSPTEVMSKINKIFINQTNETHEYMIRHEERSKVMSDLINSLNECGPKFQHLLDDSRVYVKQAKAAESRPNFVRILLQGSTNFAKTLLAAKLTLECNFEYFRLCSPEDMAGLTESAKCMRIRTIFYEAYKCNESCILVDNIEDLVDYSDIRARYSNPVFQALRLLLKKEPPSGRKLLIVCTTSRVDVLKNMNLLASFNTVKHVPNVTIGENSVKVLLNLKETENNGNSVCFNRDEISKISNIISLSIGIKKLLALVDWARQMDQSIRATKFLAKLEEELAIISGK
ncbi:vesicle-fusing ATPase 1-like [Oppia nitens]|uniref:vesicle-fusing ATPase 1-like n=1 Tax=Oppia nitens TaxID=1686743 RepID=UPI0023DBF13F|nr:vesicle-fusing ATPase 1-like [Oppia nitens]